MRCPANRPLLHYFIFACTLLVCAKTPPLRAQWPVLSWSPPPKSIELLPWPKSRDGSQPLEHVYPNLCHEYFLWIHIDRALLEPYEAFPWLRLGEKALEEFKRDKRPANYIETARRNGYSVNYFRLVRPKTNTILPILGYLFYIPADPKATDEKMPACKAYLIDPSQKAYKQLGFRKEGVYSFPLSESIAQWYEGKYRYDWFPGNETNAFRGHVVTVRKIEVFKDEQETPSPRAEMAVFPWAGDLKEDGFRWYSVGDELMLPWTIPTRKGSSKPYTTVDLKYYKITNIVPPDSPTIKVQPEDGGEPIECKPIGWVDIDIHGREEPEKKAGSP